MAYSDDAATKIKEHSKGSLIYLPAQQENIEEQKICSAAHPNVRVGRAVKEAEPCVVSVREALVTFLMGSKMLNLLSPCNSAQPLGERPWTVECSASVQGQN